MAEVIDFHWPTDQQKMLFVTNILDYSDSREMIEEELCDIFSQFGLVCEVNVVMKTQTNQFSHTSYNVTPSLYAFVKYHSVQEAHKALTENLFYHTHPLKVVLRRKRSKEQPCKVLYHKKCIALANHLFGFNGWSSKVVQHRQTVSTDLNTTHKNVSTDYDITHPNVSVDDNHMTHQVTSICRVTVDVTRVFVQSHGAGVAIESFENEDMNSKLQAFAKSKNQAYRLAMEDAFSRLLVVVLDNGKYHVHTRPHHCPNESLLTDEPSPLLTVNEYQDYAIEDDGDDDGDDDDNGDGDGDGGDGGENVEITGK